MSIKINKLPRYERPYEKLELYGEKSLSNSELLAILIENGTKEETAIQVAQKVLLLGKENFENALRTFRGRRKNAERNRGGNGNIAVVHIPP